MALVSNGFRVSMTVMDEGGNKSTLTFKCDPATVPDYATALNAQATLATNFNAVSDGVITDMRVEEVFVENAIVFPGSLVQVETKASITVALNATSKKANFKIPAPTDAIFNGASGAAYNQVDVNNASLATYVAQYHPTGFFFISDGEHVATAPNNGMLIGKRISAKNNNG